MAFTPIIKPSFNAGATTVDFLDITGLYNGTTNLTGWGTPDSCNPGDAAFNTANIVSVTIDFYDDLTAGTLLQSFVMDITDLPAAYAGDFNYNPVPYTWSHGVNNGLPLWTYEVTVVTSFGCTFTSGREELVLFLSTLSPVDTNLIKGSLDICLDNNCNKLAIKETTTVWQNGTYYFTDTAWRYNPSTESSAIKVYLDIYDIAGNLLDTIYYIDKTSTPVVDVWASPFNNVFHLKSYRWAFPDGYYKFVYKIENSFPNQPNVITELAMYEKFYTCYSKACVDALWLDAFNSCENKNYADKVETAQDAQILLQGVTSKAACIDLTKAKDMQETLLSICAIAKCAQPDCGCN